MHVHHILDMLGNFSKNLKKSEEKEFDHYRTFTLWTRENLDLAEKFVLPPNGSLGIPLKGFKKLPPAPYNTMVLEFETTPNGNLQYFNLDIPEVKQLVNSVCSSDGKYFTPFAFGAVTCDHKTVLVKRVSLQKLHTLGKVATKITPDVIKQLGAEEFVYALVSISHTGERSLPELLRAGIRYSYSPVIAIIADTFSDSDREIFLSLDITALADTKHLANEEAMNAIYNVVLGLHVPDFYAFMQLCHANALAGTKRELVLCDKKKSRLQMARGRNRLYDYHTLTLDLNEVRKLGEPKGGTHASPVMHTRRGHMRRYRDEHGNVTKEVFIGEMVINPTSEGFTEKEYHVSAK